MDCTRIDLIGYHFATLPEEDRDEVERHLRACSACLEGFLELKRHADSVGRGVRPSREARARLRREVERTFAAKPAPSPLAWLFRPIPLYQGLAGAAVVLACAALVPTLRATWHARAPRSLTSHTYDRDEGAAVDTARTTAESNTIY